MHSLRPNNYLERQLSTHLLPTSQNKKNKIKYPLVVDGEAELLCAKGLNKEHIKGCWQTLNNEPYKSKSIVVELNLARSDKEPARWVKVKLLFVRSVT
jgi:hypothetical protein